jgi:hypothetical protein
LNDLNVYPTCVARIANQNAFLQSYQAFTDCDVWMGASYRDAEVTVDLDMTQVLVDPSHQHGARILLRTKDTGTYVLIAFNPTKGDVTIWTQAGGTWNALASSPVSLALTTWYHAKVDIIGSTVSAKIWAFGTGEPGWQVTTTAQNAVTGAGQGGLRGAAADVYFANFKVTAFTGITGNVSTSTGAPIAGAQVQLSNGSTATTDANGSYAFYGLSAGSYTVTATASGYSTSSMTTSVPVGVVATDNFFLN